MPDLNVMKFFNEHLMCIIRFSTVIQWRTRDWINTQYCIPYNSHARTETPSILLKDEVSLALGFMRIVVISSSSVRARAWLNVIKNTCNTSITPNYKS